MQEILKLEEINFETNLKIGDIIEIVEMYTTEQRELYEIDKKNILYETKSYVTNEPVWCVPVIPIRDKGRWSDGYTYLSISDRERRLVYVQNDHGVVIEKF